MAEKRFYRELYGAKDLVYFSIKVEQTDLDIGARSMLRQEALQLVKRYRSDIEAYIRKDNSFLTSLVPIKCLPNAPAIVRRMCDAAQKAGVGPRQRWRAL